MYFDSCKNLNELKSAYKKLALKHHPDCGGDVRVMQEINAEYDRIFELLKANQNAEAARPDSTVKASTEQSQEFRNVIDALIRLSGIIIELCGSWLWISGDTFENREALKACGCRFSHSKKMWYWHHPEEGMTRSRGTATMGDIRAKYGSELIGSREERDALPA